MIFVLVGAAILSCAIVLVAAVGERDSCAVALAGATRTPTTPIRDVRPWHVNKVVGRVACEGAPLIAPLSGEPCAAYRTRIYRGTEDLLEWKRHAGETVERDFLVVDDDGDQIVVRPNGALLDDCQLTPAVVQDNRIEPFLDERHVDPAGPIPVRYQELILPVGQRVMVYGTVEEEADPRVRPIFAGYRQLPGARLRLVFVAGRDPLLIFF